MQWRSKYQLYESAAAVAVIHQSIFSFRIPNSIPPGLEGIEKQVSLVEGGMPQKGKRGGAANQHLHVAPGGQTSWLLHIGGGGVGVMGKL